MSKLFSRKPNRKTKSAPPSRSRRIVLFSSIAITAIIAALCVAGDFYVHHSPEWLADHRSFFTAPLEWFGDRTALITDAFGWTGHDCVYETDDPVPEGQVLFAGAPVRTGAPAPSDIVTLDRGDFQIGWSPSLRHPVWAAYHVPREARFDKGKRPAFQSDPSVKSSPSPKDYPDSNSKSKSENEYARGHMVPNYAIATRFGPDLQKKTFQMTNIAPQSPGLNYGPWREMEKRIADLWTRKYGEIWVITGAIPAAAPSDRKKLSGSDVTVPEKFYMVAVAQSDEGVRALAVLFDQNAKSGDFPMHNIVTIEELEKMSGLEFFPDMPKFLKKPLKADRPTRLWPARFCDILKLIIIRFT